MKKYEFTGRKKTIFTPDGKPHVVHQVRALTNLGNIIAGDLGGWIEREDNLSHAGESWVCENVTVCGNAKVFENAYIYGEAKIYENAKVYGQALVSGDARIYGDARIFGDAKIYGNNTPKIYGYAEICGNSIVSNHACIYMRNHVMDITVGSRSLMTFFRNKYGEISVNCGLFCGDLDSFMKEIESECSNNFEYYEICKKAVEMAKIQKRIADAFDTQ